MVYSIAASLSDLVKTDFAFRRHLTVDVLLRGEK